MGWTLAGGVHEGADRQREIAVVEAGEGVAEIYRHSGGQAGCEAENSLFSAFSELCKPSCKVGMSHQVTVAAWALKARRA